MWGVDSRACGPWYYEPQDYILFRASEKYLSLNRPEPVFSFDAPENCRLWMEDTKTGASSDQIYHVVYTVTLEEFQALSKEGKRSRLYKENAFARALWEDKEALEFLLLAKQCEKARTEMADPWYYPAKNDPQKNALAEVIEKSLSKLDSRLWKRYALQATRAMLTLGRYGDCIALWDRIKGRGWDDCLRDMAARNVAGAYYNSGDKVTAMRMYGEINDTSSMLLCSESDLRTLMLSLYKHQPDSGYLRDLAEYYHDEDIYDICLKIASEGKVKDPAYWYYIAAYIEYTNGKPSQALKTARLAEKSRGSDFVKESSHVLAIWIEAETLPYSSTYEASMLNHVKWLDSKIIEHLDEAIDDTRAYGINRMSINESYFYWNDMLRKVLLGAVCPKLVKNHREVSALGFANMADNRLLGLVNSVTVSWSELDDGSNIKAEIKRRRETLSLAEYRSGMKVYNEHDYSNAFFRLADTVRVESLIAYVQTLDKPNARQKYINERSYTSRDYLNELIGTKYLREGRYHQAVQWLEKVSPDYQIRLNTKDYMHYDPFSFRKEEIADRSDYKLNFAREMARLSGIIAAKGNPEAPLSMAKLAIGMRNSADHCWPLVFYHKFEGDFPEERKTPYSRAHYNMLVNVIKIFSRALACAYDDESKAKIEAMFGNYKTVMERYPGTKTAAGLRGKCDTYWDYHLNDPATSGKWWIDYGPNHAML